MEEGFKPEILLEICKVQMPFGKYKGKILVDLPVSYLEWLYKKGMPKGKLGMQLSTIYEIKINGLMYLLHPIIGEQKPHDNHQRKFKF